MRRLLKEPLLHFLLLGAGLFVVYALMQRKDSRREPGQIVVKLAEIEQMATGFAKTWQREPTPEELDALVRDRVREEVYSREAVALGLDREDSVIRRRLRQKMEFVSEDLAALVEPTDAELEEYLRTHLDSFRVDPRYAFDQVYLDPEKHGENLASDVARLLAQLNIDGSAVDASRLGDSVMIEPHFDLSPASEITKQFGAPFASALGRLQAGRWQGPVESGYGVHLVRVRERVEGRAPILDEVREAVRREWDDARRVAANEAFFQGLLRHYSVTIERGEAADHSEVRAAGSAQ